MGTWHIAQTQCLTDRVEIISNGREYLCHQNVRRTASVSAAFCSEIWSFIHHLLTQHNPSVHLKHPTVFVQNEMWRQDASFILLKVLKQSWFPFCTVCFPHIIYSCKRCGALQIMTWPPCAAQSAVHIESQYFQLILSPFVAITSLDWVSAEGKKCSMSPFPPFSIPRKDSLS